jgi:GntR family transcriptional regulator
MRPTTVRPQSGQRADVARRVRDALRDEIQAGRFKSGTLPSEAALLPSEPALMLRYGASRNAVRLALSLLRDEGLVERVQGIGTVVVGGDHHRVPIDCQIGFAEALEGGQTRVTYRCVSVLATVAPPGVAHRLEIAEDSDVVFVERLLLLDGQPHTLRSAWIPAPIGRPILEGRVDVSQALYDVLERQLGLELGMSEYAVEAIVADEAVASILAVSPGSPLLLLESLTRLATGQPAEFGHGRSRGDRIRFVANTSRRWSRGQADAGPEGAPNGGFIDISDRKGTWEC